ncbi:MAG: hypothetical protein EOM53_00825 [Alphaproteobacteria bacterium]|nr:hypothetical protein [Alphaproteobacteria bacterium]
MKKYILLFALCFTLKAAASEQEFNYVRYYAYQRDSSALSDFLEKGGNLDAVDKQGDTPLCAAIYDKDYEAFEMLMSLGADVHHECVYNMPASFRESFNQKLSYYFNRGFTTRLPEGTVVEPSFTLSNLGWGALGGVSISVVAIAAAGGGGSSSNNNTTDGTSDEPALPEGTEAFETAEYNQGGFLSQVKASSAYARGYTGYVNGTTTKVKVGVLDDSVSPTHSDLNDNMGSVYDISSTGSDVDSHGVHVAGIIGAEKNDSGMHGVAPNAEILVAYDITNKNASMYDGVKELVDGGAVAVNMSFGYGCQDDPSCDPSIFYADKVNDLNPTNPTYTNFEVILGSPGITALQYAQEHNVVLVIAAGNESYPEAGILNAALLTDYFNASSSNDLTNLLISVIAVNSSNTISSYSNQCGLTKEYCLAAPGDNVYSTIAGDTYGYKSGTSMATPVVTGAVALMRGAFPYLTAQQVVQILFDTATDLGTPGVDDVYGHGLLNLNAATAPIGPLSLALSSDLDGKTVALEGSSLQVSNVFSKSVIEALPQTVAVLDDYKRTFDISTQSLISKTGSSARLFQRELRLFAHRSLAQKTKISDNLSFAFSSSKTYEDKDKIDAFAFSYDTGESLSKVYYFKESSYKEEDLGEQALENPFTKKQDVYGMENTFKLNKNLNFALALETGKNAFMAEDKVANDTTGDVLPVYSATTTFGYEASKSFQLSFINGLLYEQNAMLGFYGTGAFETTSSQTYFTGVRGKINLSSKVSVLASYFYGRTRVQNQVDLMHLSDMRSSSFALLTKYALDSKESVAFEVSSPLSISKGTAKISLPTGRDENVIYMKEVDVSLAPEKTEYDFMLHHFVQKDAWNFKSSLGVRMHPDNEDKASDFRMLFSAALGF